MKKFVDAKAPLKTLMFKLQMKSQAEKGYDVFYKELENVTREQSKFLENIEYQVAVAEATDPAQDIFFYQRYTSKT